MIWIQVNLPKRLPGIHLGIHFYFTKCLALRCWVQFISDISASCLDDVLPLPSDRHVAFAWCTKDKQNLSVTTWRGEIHLRSARLKQEVVDT